MAEFTQNLQWYLDNLDYAEGWTWFDEDGNALSDEAVVAMTGEDKAQAFLEGRYAKGSSGGKGGPDGMPDGDLPSGMGGAADFRGKGGFDGDLPDGIPGKGDIVGTPDGGTTQSATGSGDSANYTSYGDMVAAYKTDIEEVYAGDKYGNNIVALYNPLNYIGTGSTEDPTWTKIIMGASEGDM